MTMTERSLDRFLREMTARGASDLHLKPKRPPLIRVNRRLEPLDDEPLGPRQIEEMAAGILSPKQKSILEERMAVDIGYGIEGLARFRGNVYLQRGTLAVSFRRIPYQIQSLDELELPETLHDFASMSMGLVLVTGPTGSGKSTTLAALVRKITQSRPIHLITVEDPIEFLFSDDVATVSQREVGTDTPSFAEALRNAMRQDPDVLMVGEMRDRETISTVITAAETGHLVFSTLHTNSASQTVDRIVDVFPAYQQAQVRAQLAQVLKGVVSMKLVERKSGDGLIAALEILKSSPKIAERIEAGHTGELVREVESSVAYFKMQSMNQSLLALLVHGTISYREAMRNSPDPEDLSLKLRRMFPKIEEHGGDMGSTADFSQILELQQVQKLYEEQEEKVKILLVEKNRRIEELERKISEREARLQQAANRLQQASAEMTKVRNEANQVRKESQEKIDKLSERIKALNQQLMGSAGR